MMISQGAEKESVKYPIIWGHTHVLLLYTQGRLEILKMWVPLFVLKLGQKIKNLKMARRE